MPRFLAGVGSTLLLVLAGFFAWKSIAQRETPELPAPPPARVAAPGDSTPEAPPEADQRTREQRRFDRADRNRDGVISLEELYAPRRRAFARLDTNGDGRLSFEEWAARTRQRFERADADRNGVLTRAEFATTAPRRRPTRVRSARCDCAETPRGED
jgi:hypothetical protein